MTSLLLGCGPQGQPADSVPAGGDSRAPDAVSGVVRVVGSAPVNVQVVLQPQGGSAIRLTGPLSAELEQLSGATVRVQGEVTAAPDPLVDRQIEATGYEILEIDGAVVVMGEVVAISGGVARLRTARGLEVRLTGVPDELEVGQKIWVQGPQSLTVQSYGIIHE
ncbi:MAG: hypothetical protein WD737_02375 [Gemmatimonadota bacterium]